MRVANNLLKTASQKKKNIIEAATLWINLVATSPIEASNPLVIKLPVLFETLLGTLGNDLEPYQVRVILEQCQTILKIALDNAKFVRNGPFEHLLKSPLLDLCLSVAH